MRGGGSSGPLPRLGESEGLDWWDLLDLLTDWGVLGDLSFNWWFLWDPSSELDRDLGFLLESNLGLDYSGSSQLSRETLGTSP